MTKNEKALQVAELIKSYCKSKAPDCKNCIFNAHEEDAVLFNGCKLNDPDHLPETWDLDSGVLGQNVSTRLKRLKDRLDFFYDEDIAFLVELLEKISVDWISREEALNMIKNLQQWVVTKDKQHNVGLLYDDVYAGIYNLSAVGKDEKQ